MVTLVIGAFLVHRSEALIARMYGAQASTYAKIPLQDMDGVTTSNVSMGGDGNNVVVGSGTLGNVYAIEDDEERAVLEHVDDGSTEKGGATTETTHF